MKRTCGTCWDELAVDNTAAAQPGQHTCRNACDGCLHDRLVLSVRQRPHAWIQSVNGNGVRCPCCPARMSWLEVQWRMRADDDVKHYEQLMLEKSVFTLPGFQHCGNTGCSYGALVEDNACAFTCVACEVTCSWCRGPQHEPGSECPVKARVASANFWNALHIAINPMIRRCPSCQTPIAKSGGCKHMTCVACRHQWCWHCKGAWQGHKCPIDTAISGFVTLVVKPVAFVAVVVGSVAIGLALSVLPPAVVLQRTGGKPLLPWWLEQLRNTLRRF